MSLNGVLELTRQRYDGLPAKQRKVADVVLQNPRAVSYASVAQLAHVAGVTQATVVRFCQELGLTGYSEFRARLRGPHSLQFRWPQDAMRETPVVEKEEAMVASIRRDLENVEKLLAPDFQAALAEAVKVVGAAHRIVVISSGSNAAVGLTLAHKLSLLGYPAEMENRGGSYVGQTLALLTQKDLVISTSFWRVQKWVLGALRWCQKQRIPTLAITNSPLAPTARLAAHTLVVPTEGVSFFNSLTAPLAAVGALLSGLATIDRTRTVEAIARAESVWKELEVFESSDE